MMNKKMMKIFILLLSFTFLSTTVFAKSTQKQSTSWWRIPYYHMLKVSKNIERQIDELQKKANKLAKRKAKLAEKVKILEDEMNSLELRQEVLSSQKPVVDKEGLISKKIPIICPNGYFWRTDEFDDYDFSGAYLKWAYFSEANLNGTNFSGANLKGSYFSGAQLNSVNFSGANLTDADFTEVVLINVTWSAEGIETTCPDGFIVSNGGSCEDHL
jgi:Pentapeptide repeats (9 copies)